MNVVIVGAAGTVGIAAQKELASHGHRLRCVDLGPPRTDVADVLELFGYDPAPPEAEWVYADIRAEETAEAAVKDMDACVYVALADMAMPEAMHFSINVAAPFQLAVAAANANLRKFAYASSVSVNNPPEGVVTELDPPRCARNAYAMSKWLAEEMLKDVTRETGLSTISLRLGTVRPHCRIMSGRHYSQVLVDVRDIAVAFRLAVEDRRIGADVFHVVSQGEPMRCATGRARDLLGFQSRYNGPEHFAALYQRQLEFARKHPAPAKS